jgi:hypothetical protein
MMVHSSIAEQLRQEFPIKGASTFFVHYDSLGFLNNPNISDKPN